MSVWTDVRTRAHLRSRQNEPAFQLRWKRETNNEMVQIIIPTSSSQMPQTDGKPGWAVIELQGTLSAADTPGGALGGLHLGTWTISSVTGTPYLHIGHHKLEGSLVQLRSPLAVVRKRVPTRPPAVSLQLSLSESQSLGNEMMMDPIPDLQNENGNGEGSQGKDLYEVIAIVRQKYLFKSRPEHVLAEEHKGLSAFARHR
ncbi:Ctf8-domain-containing protein [Powellomyces hirtus]|nr:Ctf8-domain-containing protein [Powellomyces hirtus]